MRPIKGQSMAWTFLHMVILETVVMTITNAVNVVLHEFQFNPMKKLINAGYLGG